MGETRLQMLLILPLENNTAPDFVRGRMHRIRSRKRQAKLLFVLFSVTSAALMLLLLLVLLLLVLQLLMLLLRMHLLRACTS